MMCCSLEKGMLNKEVEPSHPIWSGSRDVDRRVDRLCSHYNTNEFSASS